MIQAPSVLFMVILAAFIGAITWFAAGDRLSRLGAFVILTVFCALLPAIAWPLAGVLATSGSDIPLLLCNYLVMIPCVAWFNSGSYLAMTIGWAVQAMIMASIGFYIWSGMGRRKRRRTSSSMRPHEARGA